MRGCRYCRGSRRFSLAILLITLTTTFTIWKLYDYLQERHRQEQQYMSFVWRADRNQLQDPLIHKHNYRYILNNKTVCHSENGVFLLIYVLSSRKNKFSREIIRQTWGSVRVYKGKHVRLVFLTGHKKDGYEASLKSQHAKYGDIIEGNFIDSYKNLTYKSVMGLHWVNNFCNNTRFILKTDDDVVVNIYKLVHFLIEIDSNPRHATGFLYCNVEGGRHGAIPIRREKSKFYMNTTDYTYDLFPPYCHGPGYVFSIDVAAKLLNSTKKVPFFKFEDVFIGFCIKVAGIVPQNSFFGFYIDISYNNWKRFHWTILKHLGSAFKTNATQYVDVPEQKTIDYYKTLCIFTVMSIVSASVICSLICILCVTWFSRSIFRFLRHSVLAIVFRIRVFINRLVKNCLRT